MLQSISLPDPLIVAPMGLEAETLLREADQRIEQFMYGTRGGAIPGFVPSDFRLVDSCLRWIVQQHLSTGFRFCEWGSGFGVATMLAALQAFDACGIEVEEELVDEANALANDMAIPAQFVQGSALPEATEDWLDYLEDLAHVDTASPSGYEKLGLEVDDFDLIYVFPWPGEQQFWEKLFARYAADGALLMSYHGVESMRLQRKIKS